MGTRITPISLMTSMRKGSPRSSRRSRETEAMQGLRRYIADDAREVIEIPVRTTRSNCRTNSPAPHENKFAEIDHMIPGCGAPVLIGVTAHFECRNEYRHYGGDNIIFS